MDLEWSRVGQEIIEIGSVARRYRRLSAAEGVWETANEGSFQSLVKPRKRYSDRALGTEIHEITGTLHERSQLSLIIILLLVVATSTSVASYRERILT